MEKAPPLKGGTGRPAAVVLDMIENEDLDQWRARWPKFLTDGSQPRVAAYLPEAEAQVVGFPIELAVYYARHLLLTPPILSYGAFRDIRTDMRFRWKNQS